MPSSQHPRSSSPADPTPSTTTITTSEELSRFARYVEFRTRDLRHSVQSFLGVASPAAESAPVFHETEDEDEGLFVDVRGSDDNLSDWVGVTKDAVDCPEDPSHQILLPPRPAGPIQQTTIATRQAAQRAALQALGLTGAYLEAGLRVVAEDVGWLTHTATLEEAVRKLRARFPVLGRLEESYGRGRRGAGGRTGDGSDGFGGLRVGSSGKRRGREVVVERLGREEVERFGELVEVPTAEDGDGDGDEDEDDEVWEPFPFEPRSKM